jgi:hypothetical protein
MDKIYLQLEFGSGKFYSYSKEEKEGYAKHTSSKGNVSYRKYYDRVEGHLDGVAVVQTKFGEVLDFRFVYHDTQIHCPYQLYDQKGHISTFGEAAIKFLPELKKGEYYIMTPYNFTPEDSKYAKVGVSFKNESGTKIIPSLTNSYYKNGELVEGNIPAVKWVEKRGKNMPDIASLEEKTDYLYNVIQDNLEKLASSYTPTKVSIPGGVSTSTKSEPTPTQEPVKKQEEPKAAVVEDDEELPF